MIAAVYARKSTDEGDKDPDAKSCARQVLRAREYASKRGWVLSDDAIYQDEAVSGADFKSRAGLTRLRDAIRGTPASRS